MRDHGPTHVDAISHLDPSEDAPRIDEMPLDTFWGEGICLDVSDVAPREYIDAQRLERALAQSPVKLAAGDVLILRIGTSDRCGGTASRRPSTRGWTHRRPTACPSTARRSSAWTPPARTIRSTRITRAIATVDD